MRKRLVTAAAKYRKLADTDLAPEEVQKRRQKLVARASAVGYQLTANDTVVEVAGVRGEVARATAVAKEVASSPTTTVAGDARDS